MSLQGNPDSDGALATIFGSFVNPGVVGGWVRAGTASLLTIAIAHWAPLGDILTPEVRTAVGVVASGIVVGALSHFAKSK